MKSLNSKIAATLAALSLFSLSAVSALAETGTNVISTNTPALKHTKPKAEKKAKTGDTADDAAKVGKAYPFHGTVASVDKKALTITLAGKEKTRVITIGSKSLFEKDGKPATFGQVAVGDYAKGRLEKDGDHEVLLKGSFGLAPEKKTGEAKPAKKAKADKKPAAPATGTNAPAALETK